MLHEMSEDMETRLRELVEKFEDEFRTMLEEDIETLEGQAPDDEEGEGIDPAWIGTSDEASLEDKVNYLRDAVEYVENAARAITDACEA